MFNRFFFVLCSAFAISDVVTGNITAITYLHVIAATLNFAAMAAEDKNDNSK